MSENQSPPERDVIDGGFCSDDLCPVIGKALARAQDQSGIITEQSPIISGS